MWVGGDEWEVTRGWLKGVVDWRQFEGGKGGWEVGDGDGG